MPEILASSLIGNALGMGSKQVTVDREDYVPALDELFETDYVIRSVL